MILGIDCSTQFGSIALVNQGQLLGYQSSFKPKAHSEFINLMIEEVLKQAGIEFSDLSGVATTLGPGSFTGLRVALNAAKTIAYSLNLPLYITTTLQLLSFQNADDAKIIALNAFKSMIFFQVFNGTKAVGEPKALTIPEALLAFSELKSSHSLVGEGFLAYPELSAKMLDLGAVRTSYAQDFPNSFHLAVAAEQKNISTVDWNLAMPLYIKASEAEELRRKILIKE